MEALGKIIAEARRMSKLVEDLLALARGDARQLGVHREQIDLTMMLEEVSDRLSPAAAAKELQLHVALPSERVQVSGVASDLRRLFFILLDNAIKYTDSGAIDMKLAVECAEASITVTDTGIGIEPASLPYIFDRFWRADKVRSRAEGGVGLGLSLAAQIVQRHEGTIAVDSVLGKGSTLTVKLRMSESG